MITPTLSAPGIVLRPLRISDASALFVALSDAEVQRYRRLAPHREIAQTEHYIEDTLARGYGWAITEDGSEALGRLALRVSDSLGEFGIVLRRSAQRRGLGVKAIALAEEFAFGVLKLHILQAQIDAENQASLKLFARAGFGRSAQFSERVTTYRGARDNVILGKLNHGDFSPAP